MTLKWKNQSGWEVEANDSVKKNMQWNNVTDPESRQTRIKLCIYINNLGSHIEVHKLSCFFFISVFCEKAIYVIFGWNLSIRLWDYCWQTHTHMQMKSYEDTHFNAVSKGFRTHLHSPRVFFIARVYCNMFLVVAVGGTLYSMRHGLLTAHRGTIVQLPWNVRDYGAKPSEY